MSTFTRRKGRNWAASRALLQGGAAAAASEDDPSDEDLDGITQSYEDVEGLVVNMGILTALILSFAVGVIATAGREDKDVADTLDFVMRYENFRDCMDPNGTIRAELGIPDNITEPWQTFSDGSSDADPHVMSCTESGAPITVLAEVPPYLLANGTELTAAARASRPGHGCIPKNVGGSDLPYFPGNNVHVILEQFRPHSHHEFEADWSRSEEPVHSALESPPANHSDYFEHIRKFAGQIDPIAMRAWHDRNFNKLGSGIRGYLGPRQPIGTRMTGIGVLGVIVDCFVILISACLYISMTSLDVRESDTVRRFWLKLFWGWIILSYALVFVGTIFFLISFMYLVFVLSPSLYEHILIMDMFSATIQGVFYFVVLFISSHLVYVAWRRLRPKFRTAPLTSELDKVEREPVFTTWSAKEVSHWVLEAKAPPRLFGLANVGPLVAKAASKVSAQIFGELDASHRAEIADKMQNQMVKGTVLAGWESVARIKEDLGISIGLADDVWTAVCTLHEETEAATQEWMQLAVKSIKDDLKQSQVKAFPYKLQAAIRFFGYLVFGGCVAIFWGMDWGINCDIRPCGAANRFGLSLVSTTIWCLFCGLALGLTTAVMKMPLSAADYDWQHATCRGAHETQPKKACENKYNPLWYLSLTVDIDDVVNRMSLEDIFTCCRDKFGIATRFGVRSRVTVKDPNLKEKHWKSGSIVELDQAKRTADIFLDTSFDLVKAVSFDELALLDSDIVLPNDLVTMVAKINSQVTRDPTENGGAQAHQSSADATAAAAAAAPETSVPGQVHSA